MTYSYQSFGSGQILTAAQEQQQEDSTRDHIHGDMGVTAITKGLSPQSAHVDTFGEFAGLLSLRSSITEVACVGNDATETTVYSVTIPGKSLGSSRALEFTALGEISTTSGRNLTIRYKYGATTYGAIITSGAGVAGITTRDFVTTHYVYQGSVTTRQTGGGFFLADASTIAADVEPMPVLGTDSTIDQAYSVTVQFAAAVASNSVTFRGMRLVRVA